jgi:polysaccharide export outer membrane protein
MKIVNNGYRRIYHLCTLILLFSITACTSNRKGFTYFENMQDGNIQVNTPIPELRIEPNDQLSIAVSGADPEAAVAFNQTTGTSGTAGYLVSSDGYIEMPVLGSVKVAGLTKEQIRVQIINLLSQRKLLVDPIVSVRLMTFKVTVLGEVGRPAVLSVPNERITLLDAMALAGDINTTGRKDNILIIRDQNGQKVSKRINLSSLELFQSDYYYLKANDLVYVEPTKNKIVNSTTRTPQWIGLALSLVSFAIGVATFVRTK